MVLVVTFTNFFVLFREDRLYCDQCYKEQFVPRCAKCQDFITSVRIIIIISSVLDRTIHHYNDQIFFAISTFIMIISWLFQNSGLHPRHGPVLAPRVFCLLWLFCSGWRQSPYLSKISQIIVVEKNLSCGEILDFCKEFEQFMAFYRNLCRFCSKLYGEKSVWRKND